jgi:ribosome recycling factor
MDPNLSEANTRVDNALKHLQRELATVRAGRANPTLIEEMPVKAYGGIMKLMELGTINAPQPTLLTVQVWDASVLKDIEKAFMESNLGLSASVDGTTIRVPIPSLTEERRHEYIKIAHQKGEACKVEIRQIRSDIRDDWKKEETAGNIGEDELSRREKLLQDLIDGASATVDEYVKAKEADLSQI